MDSLCNRDIWMHILSYLDPPQILTMSVVDKYFYEHTTERRLIFNSVRYKINEALKLKSEWIIKWHIRSISDSIDSFIFRGYMYRRILIEKYFSDSLLYKNYSFTRFLFERMSREKMTIQSICYWLDIRLYFMISMLIFTNI